VLLLVVFSTQPAMVTCKLTELKVGCDLPHFACHHHVMEIIAEKVFAACNMPSTGQDILFFKRFKQQWKFIDKE